MLAIAFRILTRELNFLLRNGLRNSVYRRLCLSEHLVVSMRLLTAFLALVLVQAVQAVQAQTLPLNASPNFNGGWNCNLGYKQNSSACIEMDASEKQEQLRTLAIARARARSVNLDDHDFSLSDVERRCEAYVYDREYGELQCNSSLREVERKCEVYIHDWPNGEIDCSGHSLKPIERNCTVSMHSDEYGSVDC